MAAAPVSLPASSTGRRVSARAVVLSVLVTLAALAVWSAQDARAVLTCTHFWKASVASGDFATASNWANAATGSTNAGSAPGSGSTACLQTGAAPAITLSASRTVGAANLTAGSLTVTSVTLTLVSTTDPSTLHGLALNNGTLAGAAAVNLTGSATATNSSTVVGSGVKTVAAGASLAVDGGGLAVGTSGATAANVGKLTNLGTLSWDVSSNWMLLGGGNGTSGPSTLLNQGTWNVTASPSGYGLYDGSGGGSARVPKVVSSGTMTLSGPEGSFFSVHTPFDNTGVVTLAGGTPANPSGMHLYTGNTVNGTGTTPGAPVGTDTGTWSAASDSFINFAGGTRQLAGAAAVTGAGGAQLTAATLAGGTQAAPIPFSRLVMTGGTLRGHHTISDLVWTGGTLDGAGTTTVPAGGSASLDSWLFLDNGHRLLNQGTLTRTNNGWTYLSAGSILENAGSMTITGDGGYGVEQAYDVFGHTEQLLNSAGGVLTFSADSPEGYFHVNIPATNHGTIHVTKGVLRLADPPITGTSDTGDVVVDAGTALELGDIYGLERTLTASVDVTGLGELRIVGENVIFSGNTVSGLALESGTQTGSVDVQRLRWTGGTMTGAGTTRVLPGGTATLTGTMQLAAGHELRNEGSLTRQNDGWFEVTGGATVTNAGTWTIAGDGGYSMHDPTGVNDSTFTNTSTGSLVFTPLTSGETSHSAYIDLPLQNDGTLTVSSGLLLLARLANADLATSTLTGGTFVVNGRLQLPGRVNVIKAGLTLGAAGELWDGATDTNSLTGASGLKSVGATGALVLHRSVASSNGGVTNAGAVSVVAGTLQVPSYTQSAGSTSVAAGAFLKAGATGTAAVTVNGGLLQGAGTVQGAVSGPGTVGPGLSPGQLVVTRTYTAGPASVLAIEIGGLSAGTSYDRLAVTGAATVNGTLALSTVNGFAPAVGDTFTVLTSSARTGTFATVTGDDLPGDLYYDVSYTGTAVVLTVKPVPTLAVGSKTVTEADAGTVPAAFPVTLSAPSGRTVTVAYATSPGTATDPADYAGAAGVLTFLPGETAKVVTVDVASDLLDENDETFDLGLSSPFHALLSGGPGVGTITDNDPLPALSVDDRSVTETDAGTLSMTFTVTLSPVSGRSVTVHYATAPGTASAPADFTATSGDLTFAAGETTKTVGVVVKGDLLDEVDETLTLDLSAPVDATLADASGTGTITDNDPLPGLSIADKAVTEGNAGTTTAAFTVTLTPVSGRSVTVHYATADGTAGAPADYTATSGDLTFAAGETTKTISVPVKGDLLDEVNETYAVTLSAPVNATLTRATASGTITDNDPPPSLSVNDVSVTEGDSGTTSATFTVTLSQASGRNVGVSWATANGTAVEPADYTAATGTLSFAAGQTSKTVTVLVKGDVLDEPDEAFTLGLVSPSNATIADGSGAGTITDDDAAPALSVDDVSVPEGDSGTSPATFTVTLAAPSGQQVTVGYATTAGTATDPADYAGTSGTLTFAAGETSKQVAVAVVGDTVDEPDEAFTLDLSSPVNATLGDGSGTATITDDDLSAPPLTTVAISDAQVGEGNTSTRPMSFTLTRAGDLSGTSSVQYKSANTTATGGNAGDYLAVPLTTATFAPGEATKTVAVTVRGDTLVEAHETLRLSLSNGVGADIADATGTGTIIDDDGSAPALLAVEDAVVTEGAPGDVQTASVTVHRYGSTAEQVTVKAVSVNGSATAGTDYTGYPSTVLTFPAGSTSATVLVPVTGDAVDEPNETFLLNLSTPTKATLIDAAATVTIVDDDGPVTAGPATFLSIDDVRVDEGSSGTRALTFTVTRRGDLGPASSVQYKSGGGTATAGATGDYVAVPLSTMTFGPGEATHTITVTVRGDVTVEANETLVMTLSAPGSAVLEDTAGTGTITADDAGTPAMLSVSDVQVVEGTGGSSVATFTVTRAGSTTEAVSVTYRTGNGTAGAPGDFTALSATTLSFAAGETSKTVDVTVVGDAADEPDETFTLVLSAPKKATAVDTTGLARIVDDDA